ncbi:MAG: arylsulfotransferase [Planctomycetota bacterium]|nr:MAG: arylsulfotransferase [Planctomycetota bacterium]
MVLSILLSSFLAAAAPAPAAPGFQTPQQGHTLVAPFGSQDTHLVDEGGNTIHTWPGTALPGNATYLLENGNLVRMYKVSGSPGSVIGGSGGGVQEIDWAGNLVWDYQVATQTEILHHDLAILPNGNLLLMKFEDLGDVAALALGRDPAIVTTSTFWSEVIIEFDRETQSIVWEWHAADHVVQDFDPLAPDFDVIADRPERLNINFPFESPPNGDWTHCNAVAYSSELDQVAISAPFLDEIWVIDHGTTTAEAAGSTGGLRGRGGDLLYRWGNPRSYDRGTIADQTLWNQHDIQWIAEGRPGAGNMLVLNNGNDRPGGPFSTVDEFVTPVLLDGTYTLPVGGIYGPSAATWSWQDPVPANFFTGFIGGAERQPNGNTLIIEGGSGRIFEVDDTDAVVWTYLNPSGTPVFKARRYQKFLFPGDATLSAAVGGQVALDLVGGNTFAARDYFLAMRVVPGPPSLQRVILDFGTLDASGLASFTLDTLGPLPAAAVGRSVEIAWGTQGPRDFLSDVVVVEILP